MHAVEHSTVVLKVEDSLSVFCLNVLSLTNKAIPDQLVISELVSNDYDLNTFPRANRERVEGIDVLCRRGLSVNVSSSYVVPPSRSNEFKISQLCMYLDNLVTIPHRIIITDDLNFNVDNRLDTDDSRFC